MSLQATSGILGATQDRDRDRHRERDRDRDRVARLRCRQLRLSGGGFGCFCKLGLQFVSGCLWNKCPTILASTLGLLILGNSHLASSFTTSQNQLPCGFRMFSECEALYRIYGTLQDLAIIEGLQFRIQASGKRSLSRLTGTIGDHLGLFRACSALLGCRGSCG